MPHVFFTVAIKTNILRNANNFYQFLNSKQTKKKKQENDKENGNSFSFSLN